MLNLQCAGGLLRPERSNVSPLFDCNLFHSDQILRDARARNRPGEASFDSRPVPVRVSCLLQHRRRISRLLPLV